MSAKPATWLPSRWLAVVLFAVASFVSAPTGATEIQQVTSPGGITAWLVHEPKIPMLSMRFGFAGGSATDPAGKKGLANMVSGLLDEGAGELDSQAFQMRLEELSISLSFSARSDYFSGRLRTLGENREEAFRLLELALTAPRFDAEPVERIRRQIIAGLIRDQEDPGTVASREWFHRVLPDHPYGSPVDGDIDHVKAIEIDDLKRFASARLARDTLVIGVVGDITAAVLAPLLDRTFGALPERAVPAPAPDVTVETTGRVVVLRKEIPQSAVVFGMPGLKRDDPDWFVASVMNHILGGGALTSRLGEEVREKRGLAYSVYTYLMPLRHAATFMGGVGTQNARVAEALDIIKRELGRLRDEGVTAEELADAKAYINGSFPLRLTSSGRIAGLLVAIQRHGLGIDYIGRRPALIDAVTLEDVHRVARRLLRPEKMFIVVVGDPQGLDGDG